MAGYRETFGGNVDAAYGRGVRDITGHLERGAANVGGAHGFLSGLKKQFSDASSGARDLANDIATLQQQMAQAEPGTPQWLAWNRQLKQSEQNLKRLKRQLYDVPFSGMEKALGRVTKGLAGMNAGLLGLAFDFIIGSIKRVYELQERWTKAIGGFNMRIGGMTSNLKGATRAAVQWSSTIRGLTGGDIQEGIQMFSDFSDSIGEVIDQGDEFSKFGLQLARGFNLGGQGAGQLSKVMKVIGDNGDDAAETMKAMIKGANEAGVPVNMIAKDLVDSSKYMARFGKEGQKTFVEGAAWVRKYKISMDQLRASVEGMDMFDEAAKTASKLNAAFGTMVNSMDQMMEDDPAKRLDMIRQQMLAQGMTYDRLTPKQRRYFSETMHLTEEQTAALLDNRHANESYTDFLAKAEKKKKAELTAQQMMQKQLQATSQTMYAFGVAFDRVTVAIAKAIRPLLEVLGLAKRGGKDFTSFGDVMESITKTVVHFFESLAGNDRWMDFMRELGRDLQRAGTALKEFIMSGRAADLVGRLATGMKSFYTSVRDLAIKAVPAMKPLLDAFLFLSEHIRAVALAWAGMKGFNMLRGALTGGGRFGKMAAGVGLGAGMGQMLGGTAATVGGAVGGLAGPVGGLIGATAGKLMDKLWHRFDEKNGLERAQDYLETVMKSEADAREAQVKTMDALQFKQDAERRDRERSQGRLNELDKEAHRVKGKEISLTQDDVDALRARAQELEAFGGNTKATTAALEGIFKPGGAAHVSADALDVLKSAAATAAQKLDEVQDAAEKLAKQHEDELEKGKLMQGQKLDELKQKMDAAQLAREKDKLDKMGGGVTGKELGFGYLSGLRNLSPEELNITVAAQKRMTKDQQARLQQQILVDRLQKTVVKDQADLVADQKLHEERLYAIQLRSILMQRSDAAAFIADRAKAGVGADQALTDWLQQNKKAIVQEYGDALYDAAAQPGAIGIKTGPTVGQYTPQRITPSPMTPPSPLPARTGGAYASSSGGNVVRHEHTIIIRNEKGQEIGRKVVTDAVQGGGT